MKASKRPPTRVRYIPTPIPDSANTESGFLRQKGARNLTQTRDIAEWNPCWSAGGKFLYFTVLDHPTRLDVEHIYSLEIATGIQRQLTSVGSNTLPTRID